MGVSLCIVCASYTLYVFKWVVQMESVQVVYTGKAQAVVRFVNHLKPCGGMKRKFRIMQEQNVDGKCTHANKLISV